MQRLMKTAILGVGLFLATRIQAAPFLTCDPYPATGQQPTEFVVTISGVANPVTAPAMDVPGGKAFKLDLGPLNLTAGSHTFTAKARNLWGESADSSPFVSTVGTSVSPSGLRLTAQ